MKAEVEALFDHFADNAESYGAENLYLARRGGAALVIHHDER